VTDEQHPSRRRAGTDFSRLPTVRTTDLPPTLQDAPADHEGKRALFSAPTDEPTVQRSAAPGAVVVDCGGCGERSVLTPAQALALAVPSLHLPYLKKEHGSWMRCPACRRRTWVSVQIQL
jgi:hypothetical protein